jgi:hypothetical protein
MKGKKPLLMCQPFALAASPYASTPFWPGRSTIRYDHRGGASRRKAILSDPPQLRRPLSVLRGAGVLWPVG